MGAELKFINETKPTLFLIPLTMGGFFTLQLRDRGMGKRKFNLLGRRGILEE